jgi:serine/threonine protein kinase
VHFATRKRDMMPCALKKISWGSALNETAPGDEKHTEAVSPTKCLKEVGLLRSLQHPNVVLYLDSFLHDKELYIVLEWAGKGDLKGLISEYRRRNASLSEAGVWVLFR